MSVDPVMPWIERFSLKLQAEPFRTPSSALAFVETAGGAPAMLKVALEPKEDAGNHVLAWWAGRGAAPVFHHEGPAIVMARASGTRSLMEMSESGAVGDDEAARILCKSLNRLHAVEGIQPDGLEPLEVWFSDLFAYAQTAGGFFARSAATAERLLANQKEIVVLHGDMHHQNVLDFGDAGWLAIDPKAIFGDRAFDFANIFCNPNAEVAESRSRFDRLVDVVAEAADLDVRRILEWVFAWCGLSAAWCAMDPDAMQWVEGTVTIGTYAEDRLLAWG